jgi:hypothetical protein
MGLGEDSHHVKNLPCRKAVPPYPKVAHRLVYQLEATYIAALLLLSTELFGSLKILI